MINTSTLSALLLTLTTPIIVWAGIELSKGNYLLGVALISVVMVTEYVGRKTSFRAQAREIIGP